MSKKTKTATLEVDETEDTELTPDDVFGAEGEETPETSESGAPETQDAPETQETEPAPPELTPEEKIELYARREQVLRDAQTELNNLERKQQAARSTANSLKEPIAEAKTKVNRLINCDIFGFQRWEKEQELPLIRKAEEAANAWKNEPVSALDVTEKDKEKLAECFITCGQVSEWLCKDFPDKKPGLNNEKTKDRLRNAINKISGMNV